MRRIGFGVLLLLILPAALFAAPASVTRAQDAAGPAVGAQEQYQANLSPLDAPRLIGPGPGTGVAILLPLMRGWAPALYAALDYDFVLGGLHYSGHYRLGPPFAGIAQFAAASGPGIGIQLPLRFIALGARPWSPDFAATEGGAGRTRPAGLVSGALWLDPPFQPGFDAGLAQAASAQGFDMQGYGSTGAQRVSLGLNATMARRFDFVSSLYWQHSDDAAERFYGPGTIGAAPGAGTRFGIDLGIAYSFY